MGDVYLNGVIVGNLEPQAIGATGKVYVDSVEIGSFGPLSTSGEVLLDSVVVGTYTIGDTAALITYLVNQIIDLMLSILMIRILITLVRKPKKPKK